MEKIAIFLQSSDDGGIFSSREMNQNLLFLTILIRAFFLKKHHFFETFLLALVAGLTPEFLLHRGRGEHPELPFKADPAIGTLLAVSSFSAPAASTALPALPGQGMLLCPRAGTLGSPEPQPRGRGDRGALPSTCSRVTQPGQSLHNQGSYQQRAGRAERDGSGIAAGCGALGLQPGAEAGEQPALSRWEPTAPAHGNAWRTAQKSPGLARAGE